MIENVSDLKTLVTNKAKQMLINFNYTGSYFESIEMSSYLRCFKLLDQKQLLYDTIKQTV